MILVVFTGYATLHHPVQSCEEHRCVDAHKGSDDGHSQVLTMHRGFVPCVFGLSGITHCLANYSSCQPEFITIQCEKKLCEHVFRNFACY